MDEKTKKKSMADVGALLLAVEEPEGEGKGEGGEHSEEDTDPTALAEEAMDAFMDALDARDRDGALDAFKSLYRVCPMMDEDEARAENDTTSTPETGESEDE